MTCLLPSVILHSVQTGDASEEEPMRPFLTASQRHGVAFTAQQADDFAGRAAQHDRDHRFPCEHVDAMRASGDTTMPLPTELGAMARPRSPSPCPWGGSRSWVPCGARTVRLDTPCGKRSLRMDLAR